jgi:hypothetical protein
MTGIDVDAPLDVRRRDGLACPCEAERVRLVAQGPGIGERVEKALRIGQLNGRGIRLSEIEDRRTRRSNPLDRP